MTDPIFYPERECHLAPLRPERIPIDCKCIVCRGRMALLQAAYRCPVCYAGEESYYGKFVFSPDELPLFCPNHKAKVELRRVQQARPQKSPERPLGATESPVGALSGMRTLQSFSPAEQRAMRVLVKQANARVILPWLMEEAARGAPPDLDVQVGMEQEEKRNALLETKRRLGKAFVSGAIEEDDYDSQVGSIDRELGRTSPS